MITLEQARKVNELVSCGLVSGLGTETPGQMCIEAAICIAIGEEFGDMPSCVGPQDRAFSIGLNDSKWSSDKARAKGMKCLAIAQLGSNELTENQRQEWLRLLVSGVIRKIVPMALRSAASVHPDQQHRDKLEAESRRCELAPIMESAAAARSAARSAAESAAKSAAKSAEWAAKSAAESAESAESAAESAAEWAAEWAAKSAAKSAEWAESAAESAEWAAKSAAEWAAEWAAKSAESADVVLSVMAEIAVDAYIKIDAPGAKLLKDLGL